MKKILLIDDSIFTLHHYADVIANMSGYEVFTAEGGKEGIEKFQEIHPDFVLCDLMMPDIGGMEVLELVRKIDTTTVFLLFTADVQTNTKQQALSLGANELLEKPLTSSQIQEVLAKYGN